MLKSGSSGYAMTAFGSVKVEGGEASSPKPFGAGERVFVLTGDEGARRSFAGGDIVPSEDIDVLAAAPLFGFPDRREALLEMRRACHETTAELMRTTVHRDQILIQAVNALDDANVVINTIAIRLREWWGVHYPELSEKFPDHEAFARKVADGTSPAGPESIGIKITQEDAEEAAALARKLLSFFEERKALEAYVDRLASQVAPHLYEVAGPSLAARLISHSSGLEKLAFMPSSTVQVLGAEKALFKHLTRGTPCPKHGMIFQHPSLQSAPRDRKGKAARLLAAKIAIAARMDYFGDRKG